jgi:hypothetical protein
METADYERKDTREEATYRVTAKRLARPVAQQRRSRGTDDHWYAIRPYGTKLVLKAILNRGWSDFLAFRTGADPGVASRRVTSFGPSHGPHLPALSTPAEETIAAIGLDP